MIVFGKMWLKRGVLLYIYFNIRIILGDACVEEKKCGACISYAKERCVWCPSEDHLNGDPRCRSQSYIAENNKWCVNEVYDPESEINYNKYNNASRLQFTPRYLKAKLRPNVPINFTIRYTPAKDQPLDVYLLLDNSGSMNGLKAELSRIAIQLQADLNNKSNNVFMGVGSFIEKPAKPYTVSNLETYSFKNDLPLTNNMSLLAKTLKNMKSGVNSDAPEAGLDALMQVMVCDKEIGWRPQARRMIVYASDETYHVCGEGKMVGAIQPNDMKCHLENNVHTTALVYDYPSPGRLNKVANDKGITIIFAIKPNLNINQIGSGHILIQSYKRLAKAITNAKFSKMNNYKDIANIIISNYKKLKRSVLINYNRLPNVNLKLSPDCTVNDNSKCQLGLKESIKINATLTLTSCSYVIKLEKMLVGTMELQPNDKLTIEVDTFCNCECEKHGISSAPQCNEHGTYECGICDCNKDRVGDTCECDNNINTSNKKKCPDFCNGRGSCVCGHCQCFPGFGGNSCELSDNDCKLYDGKLCAGHGTCVNSKCICDKEWTLDDCSCSTDKSSCWSSEAIDVGSEIHCSNNGECMCNKCMCKKEYSGEYCQYCLECEKKTCKELRNYTQCVFSQNKNICNEKFNKFPLDIDSALITEKEFHSDNVKKTLICKITFENGSAINGRYGFEPSKKKWILKVQNKLEDPPKANTWVTIGAVIGSILLGGLLLLLIWKFTCDYLDAKEYEKFKAEAESAGFNVSLQNPCYKDPIVVFRNPKYNAKDD